MTTIDDTKDERHRTRMRRKKEVVDNKIAEAKVERGVIVVNTGNGKGKSSSGFGVVARALGHGMKVGVVQFIKGRGNTGEENFFRRFPDQVSYHENGKNQCADSTYCTNLPFRAPSKILHKLSAPCSKRGVARLM